MNGIRILGIIGSLRKDSYNLLALRAAQQMIPSGAVLETIGLRGIPIFNQDNEKAPSASVLELKRRVYEADGILFATPEYNYSIPGGLKNAIDWISRPYGESAWVGKPTAIMGASIGGGGTAQAQIHLRQVLVGLNTRVVGGVEVMIGNATQLFDEEGKLTDAPTRQSIAKLLEALVYLIRSSQGGRNKPIDRLH